MKLKNESGRSMVEMLGVLAIIGVLSVGGIAGYTMAMKNYKANEIINAASMLAIHTQTKQPPVSSLSYNTAFGLDANTPLPGGATSLYANYPSASSAVYIMFTASSNEICEEIVKKVGTTTTQTIYSEGGCQNGTSDIVFK
ncbi:MAG: hypothetical protein II938_02560 [Alphaproteobacteria bacterium]|nr:hypothetical protein [Alphaproteobacteria bacterium]